MEIHKEYNRKKIKTKINYEKELNEQQLAAVVNGDGKALVLAGPGSGKTRVLVYRVAYLLERGESPESILLLTFTNKAAKNMLNRIKELLNYSPNVLGGTFHHVGNTMLRKFGHLMGIGEYEILDAHDAREVLKKAMLKIPKKEGEKFPSPSVIHPIISFARNAKIDLNLVVEEKFPEHLRISGKIIRIAKEYGEIKKSMKVLDFDDLLVLWDELLGREEVKEYFKKRFKFVLVDEFQDTNKLQFEIIRKIEAENIMVVGDDCQSIYAFRAAEIKNIFDFLEEYKDAKTFKLEVNYRSHDKILHLVNESIKNNAMKLEKTLTAVKSEGKKPLFIPCRDEDEEAEKIADSLEEFTKSIPPKEIGILFRADYQSARMEIELMRRGIPFVKRGGLKFFEQAHIKDITAFLKVVGNAKDEIAWKRALMMFEGIGEASAEELWQGIMRFSKPAERIVKEGMIVSGRVHKGFTEFRKMLLKTYNLASHPGTMAELFVEEFYAQYMKEKYPDFRNRLYDVKQYVGLASRYSDFKQFFEDVVLDADLTNYGEKRIKEEDVLVLSTIHQAKGLEWEVVFVMGLASGRFPIHMAFEEDTIEEERRLFYVACSRAKNILVMTAPLSALNYWNEEEIQESCFISELPADVYERE